MDAVHWVQHSTPGLLLLCALAIAALLAMIIRYRVEPFIALLVTGLLLALAAGVPVGELVGSAQQSSDSLLEKGFGSILGHITAIVGLGAVLGAVLEDSGGAQLITRRLLAAVGQRRAPLAMGLAGLVFGVPVFFDIGIFVLAPLVFAAARQGGRSLLLYCLPLVAGLSMTHAFLPPHPGPVVVSGLLGVGLGWVIVMGLICGIPAFLVAGVAYPAWIGERIRLPVPDTAPPEPEGSPGTAEPPLAAVALVIGLPVLLILGGTFAGVALPPGTALDVLSLLGNPVVALTIAVLLAFRLLARGRSAAELAELTARALRPLGMILLVVGAGGFFGKVLDATGVGDALAGSLQATGLPLIAAAYVISSGLRIAQGSATVAIVTAGGIVAPLLAGAGYSQPRLALVAVTIGAGSIIASHVNDGGFWIISRYFGIPVADMLKTWTVLETILSVVAFAMAAVLCLVV